MKTYLSIADCIERSLTKGDVAEQFFGDTRGIDMALPQNWLERVTERVPEDMFAERYPDHSVYEVARFSFVSDCRHGSLLNAIPITVEGVEICVFMSEGVI